MGRERNRGQLPPEAFTLPARLLADFKRVKEPEEKEVVRKEPESIKK